MVLQSNSDKVPVTLVLLIGMGLLFIGYHSIVNMCINMCAHTSSNKADCYPGLHTRLLQQSSVINYT